MLTCDVKKSMKASRAISHFFLKAAVSIVKTRRKYIGKKSSASVTKVQNLGPPGRKIHPATSSTNRLGSSRLRRRLSTIFHLETSEMGFGTRRRDSSGTHPNYRRINCHSTRIQ